MMVLFEVKSGHVEVEKVIFRSKTVILRSINSHIKFKNGNFRSKAVIFIAEIFL